MPPTDADDERFCAEKPPVVVKVDFDNQFKLPTNVIVGHNLLRYRKVTGIETQSREYRHVYDLFMSDEIRKRLNLDYEAGLLCRGTDIGVSA